MKRIMLIGGTDSSGGAGLTRDTAVTQDHGCLAKPVVTCVTAQTNSAVSLIHQLPANIISEEIKAGFADTPPDAIKIGMVGSNAAALAIANALTCAMNGCDLPIVLDPVLNASSGGVLSTLEGAAPLFQIASLLTPNLDEAATLSGQPLAKTSVDLSRQAGILRRHRAQAVLIKGGHRRGERCCDQLFEEQNRREFCLPRLAQSKRGTGCTLATAIACQLAAGHDLQKACWRAKIYVQAWMSR
ncbi:hydroxymethylpyrimidine/phosphomethylpyrimidine kinase [Aliiroseovarius lamellibrachiae]|uniref:hydroxymethylpyrimidine/phosphomethylpyrimidine kinase n=1 Tax=Aliiroseovarius lamellibrachiae TaxID=1924933 RepID=UPI001BE0E3B1|nr:hydroxymethylpyrimidine/phosphomethylpyrimidine kinase [Aliiroseovarius lamellibrachiae]MBT2131020.1 hydroxymethylpyrimidine/phosphomethylpyrimidine kinase [Aliiroseovarius lamellibrachiae]